MINVLIVIPARGGSKGIPRKNIRPLAGLPLIHYSIDTALKLKHKDLNVNVLVSSEDNEILEVAKRAGAEVYKRPHVIAKDSTTLDPVIFDAYKNSGFDAELIVTMQPTSPLLKKESLERAILTLVNQPSIDTVISVVEDKHLCWTSKGGRFVPAYEKRVNRQQLPENYKETGSFLITRKSIITEHNRIGNKVSLEIISPNEAIDIDNFEDWNLCEYYLKKKSILFNVSGYKSIGMGHVYNALSIAHEILDHEIIFLFDKKSKLGYDKVNQENYRVYLQKEDDILDDILKLDPDLVINDCLDTEKEFIERLKSLKIKVINFEDLGSGAKNADLVINAMYPENETKERHYFGKNYFVLRDEFITLEPIQIRSEVKNILISYGGVDPNNFTLKALEALYAFCQANSIKITVVAGKGYDKFETIEDLFEDVSIIHDVSFISNFMSDADLLFTSAGRTTFEASSLGLPTIVMSQNKREATHFFAEEKNGFINLGLGELVTNEKLKQVLVQLVEQPKLRRDLSAKLLSHNLRQGKRRVIALIKKIIHE